MFSFSSARTSWRLGMLMWRHCDTTRIIATEAVAQTENGSTTAPEVGAMLGGAAVPEVFDVVMETAPPENREQNRSEAMVTNISLKNPKQRLVGGCVAGQSEDRFEDSSRHGFEDGNFHYSDVIMSTMTSQIISLIIVHSTVYSGTDQRKHQSSASLAFARGDQRWSVNSPHKGPVTRKMFPFDDVIMTQ